MDKAVVAVAMLTGVGVVAAGCVPYPTWHWEAVPTDQYNVAPGREEAIKVGQTVRARSKKTGQTYQFKVQRLEKDGFLGLARDNKSYKTLYDGLGMLEVSATEWHAIMAAPFQGASEVPGWMFGRDEYHELRAVPTDQYNLAPGSDAALQVGDVIEARDKATGVMNPYEVQQIFKDGFIGRAPNSKDWKIRYDSLGFLGVRWEKTFFVWRRVRMTHDAH